MSQKEKLLKRLLSRPNDFTFDELKKVLISFGYTLDESRSGSRVSFIHESTKKTIILHKPHPGNTMKQYQLNEAIKSLEEANLI